MIELEMRNEWWCSTLTEDECARPYPHVQQPANTEFRNERTSQQPAKVWPICDNFATQRLQRSMLRATLLLYNLVLLLGVTQEIGVRLVRSNLVLGSSPHIGSKEGVCFKDGVVGGLDIVTERTCVAV